MLVSDEQKSKVYMLFERGFTVSEVVDLLDMKSNIRSVVGFYTNFIKQRNSKNETIINENRKYIKEYESIIEDITLLKKTIDRLDSRLSFGWGNASSRYDTLRQFVLHNIEEGVDINTVSFQLQMVTSTRRCIKNIMLLRESLKVYLPQTRDIITKMSQKCASKENTKVGANIFIDNRIKKMGATERQIIQELKIEKGE